MVEEELEIAWISLCNKELLDYPKGKELPLDWALFCFWALSKCQFGGTVGEATQCGFLCHLLPCEDKLVAIQTNIGWV